MKYRIKNQARRIFCKYFNTRSHNDKIKLLDKIYQNTMLTDRIREHFVLLDKVFPNRWDIQLEGVKICDKNDIFNRETSNTSSSYNSEMYKILGKNFRIIIHFPKTTIIDKYNNSINVENLFISILYKIEGNRIVGVESIDGKTLTFKGLQIESGYMHSHISPHNMKSNNNPSWSPFCLGSSEIALLKQKMCVDINYPMSMFHSLLINIKILSSNEYSDGIPNIRIQSLGKTKVLKPLNHLHYLFTRVYKIITNNIFDYSNINVIIENNKLIITNPQELEGIIKEALLLEGYKIDEFSALKIGNNYYEYNNNYNYLNLINNKKYDFHFRGVPIYYEIIFSEKMLNENIKIVINPKLIEYVQKRLQDRGSQYYFISYITSINESNRTKSSIQRPVMQHGRLSQDTSSEQGVERIYFV